MTLVLIALFASLTSAAAAAQEPSAAGPPLEIQAVAVDRRGAPVTDLRPGELEVWIAGRRIPIESVRFVSGEESDRARAVTLLIDDITLTPTGLQRAKEVARRFVSRMGPGDHVAVMPLSGGRPARSTDDPEALRRAIESVALPATAFMRPEDLSEHVLNTLATIARQMGESDPARKAIVLIGAAWLADTPIPPIPGATGLQRVLTDAARALSGAGVALYAIDPGGVGMSPFASGGRSGFAHDMGGHAFVNTNDLTGAAERILRELATYYTIRVQNPPLGEGDPLRELDVRVKRGGVTIRTHRLIPGRR